MSVAENALPLATVDTAFTPLAKVALAPVTGAVNVTVTPFIPLPALSSTRACSREKVLLISALCGSDIAVMLAGAPGLFVNAKVAAPVMLGALACTV